MKEYQDWEYLFDSVGLQMVIMELHRGLTISFLGEKALPAFQAITASLIGEALYEFLKAKYPGENGGIEVSKIAYDMREHVHPSPKSTSGQGFKARLKALGEEVKQDAIVEKLIDGGYSYSANVYGKNYVSASLYIMMSENEGEQRVATFVWYPERGYFSSCLYARGEEKPTIFQESEFHAQVLALLFREGIAQSA